MITAKEIVKKIDSLNKTIAKYERQKAICERNLIDILEHNEMGQRTFHVQGYKVTIKNSLIYAIDKKKYNEFLREYLAPPYWLEQVIEKKTKLEVNVPAYKETLEILDTASKRELVDIVTCKPSKTYVKVEKV